MSLVISSSFSIKVWASSVIKIEYFPFSRTQVLSLTTPLSSKDAVSLRGNEISVVQLSPGLRRGVFAKAARTLFGL